MHSSDYREVTHVDTSEVTYLDTCVVTVRRQKVRRTKAEASARSPSLMLRSLASAKKWGRVMKTNREDLVGDLQIEAGYVSALAGQVGCEGIGAWTPERSLASMVVQARRTAELAQAIADERRGYDPRMFPIVVVAYDPTWPRMFERERAAIRSALGDLRVEVEHIGSTSVPGLAAKPKIDIVIGLPRWEDLDAAVDALLRIGYEHEPQLPRPRTFSMKRGRPTTHRVRFVERDGELWKELISFREALRSDPELAARYGALKQELAGVHRDDHQAYTAGKGPFIEAMLQQVRGGR